MKNNRLYKCIIATLCIPLLYLLSYNLYAEVSATIDRNDISLGETFILTIESNTNSQATPDLSLLPDSLALVSNSQYMGSSSINGKSTLEKGWKLTLKALKEGKITIPSIPIGNEKTQPIYLNITKAVSNLSINQHKNAIFLTAEIDADLPYVQQEVVYTLSLYRSIQAQNESLPHPTVENAIIEPLGEGVSFQKVVNNKNYAVYQRKYAVYPQKSGEITISSAVYNAEIYESNNNSRRRPSIFSSTRPISVASEPVTFKVKAKPANAQLPWLPIKNLTLNESWPKFQEIRVGEPLTWTINLTAKGLSESQLPEIKLPQIDGLQIYPDTPQKQSKPTNDGFVSQQEIKFAIIPSKQGLLNIPAIKLRWWDVKSNQEKTASLPAKSLTVLESLQPITEQFKQPTQIPVQEQTELNIPSNMGTPQNGEQTLFHSARLWQIISGLLLALWLITLSFYFMNRKSMDKKINKSQNIKKNTASEKSQLKEVLKQGDPGKIEKSLLGLVNAQMVNAQNKKHYHSLGSLCKDLSEQTLIDKIQTIEKHKYSASQQKLEIELNDDDVKEMLLNLSNLSKNKRNESVLPPLYTS